MSKTEVALHFDGNRCDRAMTTRDCPKSHRWFATSTGYTPSEISGNDYPVTGARLSFSPVDDDGIIRRNEIREVVIGQWTWESRGPITAIIFYTGFAGCPARYYVTTAGINGGHETTSIHTLAHSS